MPKPLRHILTLFLLICGCALIYGQTLDHSFHFDDYYFITENQGIRDVTDWKAIWYSLGKPTRFIGMLSFAVNYHFHGIDVTGYHVVNILIHMLNSCLVYWLALMTFNLARPGDAQSRVSNIWLAGLAAGLFASHPLNTQAVTYICQRFASLATLFYLSALCCYLAGRQTSTRVRAVVWFGVSVLLTLLGLFTKQIVITLPVIILLYEFLFFKTRLNVRRQWPYLTFLLILMLIIPTFYHWDFDWLFGVQIESRSHEGDIINSQTYLLSQFRVLPTYMRLLIFPVGQTLDYDFKVSTTLWDAKTLGGLLLILGVWAVAIRQLIRKRLIVGFGMVWFFVTIALESSIVPIYQVIFEHRCYLPSVGLSMALAAWLDRLIVRRRHLVAVLMIIILTFSWAAYKRNQVWANETTLWTDIQSKAPQKMRPYIHLGVSHIMNGEYDLALKEFNQALKIRQDNYKVYHNRGIAYEMKKEFRPALADYTQAIQLNPHAAVSFANRGGIHMQLGQFQKAMQDLDRAIELDPDYATAYLNRGNIYYRFKHYKKALDDFVRAKQLGSQITPDELEGVRRLANP